MEVNSIVGITRDEIPGTTGPLGRPSKRWKRLKDVWITRKLTGKYNPLVWDMKKKIIIYYVSFV